MSASIRIPERLLAAYLERLQLPQRRHDDVARAAASAGPLPAAFTALHAGLAGHAVDPQLPAYGSLRARLDLVMPEAATQDPHVVMRDVQGHDRISTTPRLERVSMVPSSWPGGFLQRLAHPFQVGAGPFASRRKQDGDGVTANEKVREGWFHAANRRRFMLLGLALAQTWLATMMMSAVLPYHGQRPLELAILVLFAILFTWVSMGFWTAIAGFVVLATGRDRYAISRTASADAPISADSRTAIIMPICNENVPRVFAGLRATYESLARTGQLEHFDFFVLSDTGNADTRVAEVTAWNSLCNAVDGYGRIFYRWRRHRIKRKSGNIADFCRRWGSRYRYMIVLDADSVMSGECLTALVRLAEANPTSGIIQTAPRATGRDTLYARMQQFATRLYGPLFTAGLHYWQLGESHYWGHNAIIRVAPFIRYCALGRLPGSGALAGEILSHDFVEAALMRRAGWAVWIAYDLPGSYEEMPPNLIDELQRDRRWCQGNLMNFRLFLLKGLHPAHRVVFMTGVMAYLSAPLWFLFLLLSTVQLGIHTLVLPEYFVEPYQLFPRWPEWRPEWAIGLVGATATLLFLPKLLSVLLVREDQVGRFGGSMKLVASVGGELLASALLAPIRMLFHTRFVVTALAGWSVSWKSPPREDAQTGWGEAFRRHGLHTAFGVAWAALVYWLNPAYLFWLLPVVGALILSIPISVYTSRASLGRRLRRRGLFVIPEEAHPPQEISATMHYLAETPPTPGFVDAVVDPATNTIMGAVAIARPHQPPHVREQRHRITELALSEGPDALTPVDKSRLLNDAIALSELHFRVWTQPSAHPRWQAAKAAIANAADAAASRAAALTGAVTVGIH